MNIEKHKKRKLTPKEIYLRRASQQDFCHLSDISDYLLYTTLTSEDYGFYVHNGINIYAIQVCLRDFLKNKRLYLGSTISQQLVKNLYFSFERSWIRKVKEVLLTLRFENQLSKNQILELYLNIIYFDNGQYGISNAARFYFRKTPKELTLNQSVFLALLLPVVGIYNPLYHPDKYAAYRDKKIHAVFRKSSIYENLLDEIQNHSPNCLDEELCRATKETDIYNRPGPMINERFGPDMPESLIYK